MGTWIPSTPGALPLRSFLTTSIFRLPSQRWTWWQDYPVFFLSNSNSPPKSNSQGQGPLSIYNWSNSLPEPPWGQTNTQHATKWQSVIWLCLCQGVQDIELHEMILKSINNLWPKVAARYQVDSRTALRLNTVFVMDSPCWASNSDGKTWLWFRCGR